MTDIPQIVGAGPGSALLHIADRVIGCPLLIHPTKAEVILHVLDGRIPISGALAPLGPEANRFMGSRTKTSGTATVADGVAIIPVIGSLVNRGAWIGTNSGTTSYEGIAAQVRDARSDPNVRAIVLDLDSPGGEATGMFGLAAAIRETAKEKPVVALVNDMAASAAYGIASQATEIVVSPTSVVGSIGVVLTHFDRSGEMAAKGIKPTLIYAGANKVDGNPFGPLSDAVRADLQSQVAKFYDQFVSLVAVGRGDRLTEQDARATEARTFLGQEAVDRGLADRVASFDAVLASLQSEAKAPARGASKGVRRMAAETEPMTTEAHAAAVASARAEGHAAGLAEGKAVGAKEATDRIGAILNCEEAKGREALAAHIAFKTAMSADDAKGMLAASPLGGPAAGAGAGQSMQQRQNAAGDFGPAAGPAGGASASAGGGDVWAKVFGKTTA